MAIEIEIDTKPVPLLSCIGSTVFNTLTQHVYDVTNITDLAGSPRFVLLTSEDGELSQVHLSTGEFELPEWKFVKNSLRTVRFSEELARNCNDALFIDRASNYWIVLSTSVVVSRTHGTVFHLSPAFESPTSSGTRITQEVPGRLLEEQEWRFWPNKNLLNLDNLRSGGLSPHHFLKKDEEAEERFSNILKERKKKATW